METINDKVRAVLSCLKKDGEARLILNGRDFRFYMNGMSGLMEGVEVTEVQSDNSEDFIFEALHDYEVQEWIEEKYRESAQFLWCYTSFGEWVSKIASLAEIARTIGCRDFNETDNHRVYAIMEGIPEEIEWADNARNLCVDFEGYGSYEYPDH